MPKSNSATKSTGLTSKDASKKQTQRDTVSEFETLINFLKSKKSNVSVDEILKLHLNFSAINFDNASFELLVTKLAEASPFVFYQFPFNEIKNWRELFKSNSKLEQQNKMLLAMDSVNYFSKNDLLQFKEKYDNFLRTKTFYNYFIEKAKNAVIEKVENSKESRKLEKVTESLNYIETTFKKYRYFIDPINANKNQTLEITKKLNHKYDELIMSINADFDNLLIPPQTLLELIGFITDKFDRMLVK